VKVDYVIEFFVEYSDSFNEVERKFIEGHQKTILEEIPLWIKMVFVNKGVMQIVRYHI
jgi:hypothetical protein